MAKEESILTRGTVIAELGQAMFKVKLDGGGAAICQASGRMRGGSRYARAMIKILVGDDVEVQLSPYDLGRGRITYRGKREEKCR